MRTSQTLVESTAWLHGTNDLAGMLARDLIETQKIIEQACDVLGMYEGPAGALAAVLILNRALPKVGKRQAEASNE